MMDIKKLLDMDNLQSIEFDIMFRDEKTGYVKYDKETGELIAESYVDSLQKSLWKPGRKVDVKSLEGILEDRCFERGRGDKNELLYSLGLTYYNPQNIVKKNKRYTYGGLYLV